MNLLKILMVFGVVGFLSKAYTEEGKIYFHVDCDQVSSDCIEMRFSSDEERVILVRKEPEMSLSQIEISDAKIIKGEYGQDNFQLTFEKSAAEKFGQITGDNIGKQLVIVAGKKALTAPTIQQAITSGSIIISGGITGENKYLDYLPWLKKMTEDKMASKERLNLFSILSFVVFGLLLIGGSIYFAFFRKQVST